MEGGGGLVSQAGEAGMPGVGLWPRGAELVIKPAWKEAADGC